MTSSEMTSRFGSHSIRLLLAISLLAGCQVSSYEDDAPPGVTVFVANQGNFGDGNGSVTSFDPESGATSTMARNLASIVQSVLVSDNLVLVASNTGNRIDVFDAITGARQAQIDSVASPRYMSHVSGPTFLVSNLFGNSVSIIDLQSRSVVATIGVGPNPEGILVDGTVAYVANHGFGAGSTLSVLDLTSRTVTKTISVDCDGPRFTFLDGQNELLVVCTGHTLYDDDYNVIGSTNGAVLVLDPASGSEKSRINLDGMILTAGPGQDAFFSPSARRLFVVKEQSTIVVIDTDSNGIVASVGPLDGDAIGGVAYREADGRLYIGRVPGFTSIGSVTIMTVDGTVIGSFSAGVAPSHIDFRPE